jgi:phage gp36-like protein
MAFISDNDYKVVIGDSALAVVSKVTAEVRRSAELQAQEEIASYLRPKYDVTAVFAKQGDDRNELIVMFTCDIALYNMVATLPGKMGLDIRKERYDRAIKWLEGVQEGKIVPDLPVPTDDDGNEAPQTFFRISSEPKQHYNW